MTKPPIRKTTQADFVQVKLRMPPAMHAELSSAAEINGWSLNAELLSRLQQAPLEDLRLRLERVEAMLRRSLDQA